MSTYARLYMLLTSNKDAKPVKGDVADREFPTQIEVEDWDWKLTRPEKKDLQPEDGRTKAGEFNFTKVMDRASTQMLRFLASNTELTAHITLRQSKDYTFELLAKLEKVRISSYSFSAKDDEKNAAIEENWTFKYETITFEHKPGLKDASTLSTTHIRSSSDNAKAAANPSKAVIDDFKDLRRPDQLKAKLEIDDFMKMQSQKPDEPEPPPKPKLDPKGTGRGN